ncbi:MAG TPA: PAS domain S-box protein, partial [Bacteroidia bacterium]|nr:PAS domain S-box protein [Bacteroidia bacterium]
KKDGIEVELDGKLTSIAIEVIPFKDEDEDNYLVVFKETPLAAALPASKSSAARIKQLEQELIAAREDMRSVIEEQERVTEELQSANEEIVSSNEELQSINEELETSKEELESGNEELMTINHELQTRNNQLAEAQEYAEAIFSTIREAVIVLDGDLRVKSANSAFYSIFNVFENETVGRKIYELGNGQWNIPPLRKLMEDVIPKNALITGYEVRHTFPDIGYKVMRLNARRVIHITHRQLFILLSVQDITEHETALEIIKNREIIFREMANNAPVMIWVADKTRNRNFFNSTWLEYTGKTMEQEAGTGWKDGIHEEDIKGFLHAYIENFEARKPFHLEYRLRRNDGEYRWVLDNGKPTFDLNGEFTGFTGSCTEIHDRRLLYQELEKKVQERTSDLKEANDSLERSNSELQQFAYVASHDLQEPLRKIVTFSDRLKEKYSEALPTEAKDYVGRIITSAQRMTGLIDDLLNFSKVIKLDDQFKKADLNAIIRNLKREFEVSISQKNAKVTADKLPVINAIPVQINQLFYNLIGNALKFATDEKPPEISITVQLPGAEMLDKFNLKKYSKYYEIIVKDNGIGFSQEYAEQIFVIFQRLNERKQYPGTGIGLALCRKIVNYHDGAIFSRSREGDGAEFHIILPDRKEKQLPVN